MFYRERWCRAKYNDHALPIFKSMHFLQLNDIYELHVLKYMHAYIQKDLPSPIIQLFTRNTEIHDHNTRQNVNPHVQIRHTSSAAKSIVHCGPMLWSKLPNNLKITCSRKAFIKRFKKHILTNYWCICMSSNNFSNLYTLLVKQHAISNGG